MIAEGMAWLGGQMKAHESRPVTYSRGAKKITIDRAVKGRSQVDAETSPDFGAVQRYESVDWIVDAADIDFGGGPEAPKRGDRITDTRSGASVVYEVMPFGLAGDSHWRWADPPNNQRLRIHTKLVDTI
jgi:hypothetical protein